jgi:hypothetical protein
MPARPRLLGSPRGECCVCFHTRRTIGLPAVPSMLSHRVHSPLCRSPLQSSFNPITARSFRKKQLPTLVLALTRRHPDSSTFAEVPNLPLRSVLRCSQPLDSLLQVVACEFIPPRCRAQDRPVQGFVHFAQPPCPHRPGVPPCR